MESNVEVASSQASIANTELDTNVSSSVHYLTDIECLVTRYRMYEGDILNRITYRTRPKENLKQNHGPQYIVADVRLLLKPEVQLYNLLEQRYNDIVIELQKIDVYHNAVRLSRERMAYALTQQFNSRLDGFPERFHSDFESARCEYLKIEADLLKQINKYWLCYHYLNLLAWLKDCLHIIETEGAYKALEKYFNFPSLNSISTTVQGPPNTSDHIDTKKTLTLRQIALLCIHSGKAIDNKIASQLAKDHGLNSGEKVMQFYNSFHSTASRTRLEGKQVKPMIVDLKAILPYLTNPHRNAVE
jgi:hypothetical protein